MCGICGFSGYLPHQNDILEAMKNRIIHRGPDDEGSYLTKEVALGFRRLSIIDLDHGAQPMKNTSEDIVVVFNGEIYNYQELRKELEALGYVFQNHSDTETLIHGYAQWGSELPKHLRGMFAFVIYDKKQNCLFGARDYFGIKPFYYSLIDGHFVFGSECKSILEYPGFKKEVNLEALEQYLSFQYSVLEETFFKGIFKLAPGHQFFFKDGKLSIASYWQPSFEPQAQSLEESIRQISQVMESSTASHQIADVEVGSLLSSGIDSSYIVALGKPDKTFTVGFDYEKFNEIPYAKELSDTLGVHHHHQMISTKEYWDSLSQIQYFMDEPLADASAVALYFVDKLAAQHVKVVLSGEGADELFGGYVIYHEPLSLKKYQKVPKTLRRGVAAIANRCLKEGIKGRSFLIRGAKDLSERFIGNAYRFNEEEKKALLKHPLSGKTPQDLTAPYYNQMKHLDEPTQMQGIDLNFWLVGDILLKGDKMSMANSLETRVPFLDKEVFEVARHIPLEHKLAQKTTKYTLRQSALAKIPAKSASRPKLGFPVPIGIWLQSDEYYCIVKKAFTSKAAERFFHTDYLLSLLNAHKEGRKDYSKHIWTVYMFLLWYDVYFENPMKA